MRALHMTFDPNVSACDLQSAIAQDQALSAKILRIVNSAMYCLRGRVSTVSHAVAVLGIETVRSIIMSAFAEQVFRSGMATAQDLGTKLMSDHSWGAALAARTVARRVRYESPEEALVCGLMHDIGKPILLQSLQDRYMGIISDAYRGESTFHEAELQAFGFSHAHVGALLAEKWRFPPQLSEAIGYHHDPLSAPNWPKLACIVNLANLFMVFLEIGFEKNKTLALDKQPSAEYLKLDSSVIDVLATEIRAAFQMPTMLKG